LFVVAILLVADGRAQLPQYQVNHSATISGLSYDTEYEYRVNHLRAGQQIGSFQKTFRTCLPPGDPSPFTFVAYGDSADLAVIQNFRSVQNQINQLDAANGVALSLSLSDNAYPFGRHRDFDARFDPTDSPEHVQYIARRIDYPAIGNHDIFDGSNGQSSRDNVSVPRNGPSAGEFPEHNYSFDFGTIHFATFDSNSLSNRTRLENQLEWLVTDMQASDAQWKVIFVHHPIAGSPDKRESPTNAYFREVVSQLREAKVDLLLAGHSHMYHRTQPLFGASGSQAIFLEEADDDYTKGLGLIQLTSGVGGRSLRFGSFTQYPFNAAGFSRTTEPASEFGFTQIDVTQTQLTLSYIGADQGQVKDSFTITEDLANQLVWSARYLHLKAPATLTGARSGEVHLLTT